MANKSIPDIQSATAGLFAGMKPAGKAGGTDPNGADPNNGKPNETERNEGKTTFSAWVKKEDIVAWDRYITIAGITRAQLTHAAITDYIAAHPLTDDQKRAYMQSMGLL